MTVEQTPTVELPPQAKDLPQDEEWCIVTTEAGSERVRFHDYGRIYDVPGLYEKLFHDVLECCSPRTVTRLLREAMTADGSDSRERAPRVLELGAGNGMVGELLREMGADPLVAVDVIPEAAAAARRDRPGIYDNYIVDDLASPSTETRNALDAATFDVLVTVAALGFDDLPPAAFATGFNAIERDGWVAFNIKDRFLSSASDDSGFSGLIGEMVDGGVLRLVRRVRYTHRLSMAGDPLHYVALVGRKLGPIPADMVERCA